MASSEFEAVYKKILSRPPIDSNITIQEVRALFEKLMKYFPPDSDVQFQNMKFGKLCALKCSAPVVNEKKVILFFHGGAYNSGSNFSHRALMGKMSKASHIAVIGIDYRLAPEYPYPSALEDAFFVYQQLLQSYPPSKIILAGISAGGGLILALMLYLKKQEMAMPACAVCLCPWVDLALTGKTIQTNSGKDILPADRLDSAVAIYCTKQNRKDPLISPLYGDLSGLPPLFIQVGEKELLLDENLRLAEKAKEQKVEVTLEVWPEMFHAWQLFAQKIPEGRQAIEKIGHWILNLN